MRSCEGFGVGREQGWLVDCSAELQPGLRHQRTVSLLGHSIAVQLNYYAASSVSGVEGPNSRGNSALQQHSPSPPHCLQSARKPAVRRYVARP